MNIALFYAMPSEIDSLIQGAAPMETVHGVSFYRIRPNVIACCGGVGKVNAAMATQLLISLYQPDLVPHRPAHRVSGGGLGICPARCGHHRRR